MISARIGPSGSIARKRTRLFTWSLMRRTSVALGSPARTAAETRPPTISQAGASDARLVDQLEAESVEPLVGVSDVGGSLTGGSVSLESSEETTGPLVRGNGRRKGSRINFRCGGPFGRWNHGRGAFIGTGSGLQGPRTSRSFGSSVGRS